MKKLLLKWFLPSPEEMAKIVSQSVARFVNNTNKADAIAAFFEKTKEFSDAQVRITKWLSDGKFDEDEVKELQEELEPVMTALYNKVMEKV